MTEFDSAYTQYQLNRSRIRKLVRRIYLQSAQTLLRGPTLDFGCGVGELLERLPDGSRGLEYNRATVRYCRERGLAVDHYDGESDDWSLGALVEGPRFESMVISHVLEHLEQPHEVLRKLSAAASRLGIRRILVVVPGQAGFRADASHRTFVDAELLSQPRLLAGTGFRLCRWRYFPGNVRTLGNWFTHHELQSLFVADDSDP
ncbi:class I SAM-dependent methyltransferase [Xanthomonas sp. NCPPB 1638]|uniref:class I SAM-dependent methyltransferase n=1 Tax=Xanthomonas sp. NCPPB 1638 TaxID=487535 RepID=UPI003555C659